MIVSILINIDIITGIASSLYQGHRLKSSISYTSLFKKFTLYLIPSLGFLIDRFFLMCYNDNEFNATLTLSTIVVLNELISIYENISIFNILGLNYFIEKIKGKFKNDKMR